VIITGLNALVDYDIIVPAFDSDADGIYDYTTAVFAMTGGFQGGAGVGAGVIGGTPTTLTIALNRVGRDDAIALAAISGMDGGGQITSWNDTDIGDAPGVTTTGNIVFVFTYPVSLVSGSLNLVTDETLGVTLDINDDADVVDVANVAATGTLSAGGTVLTIDPTPTQLTANSQVVIGGLVTASGEFGVGASPTNADNTTADLNTLLIGFITAAGGTNLNGSYYVQTDSWTATSVPTLDNYDGVADGTGNGAANCLFAEFPERVYGSATVNSLTTTAGGAVALTPSTTIDLTTGSAAGVCAGATTHVVNEGVNGGCADADDAKTAASAACTTTGTGTLKYRVPLGIGIADDVTGAINTVQGTMTATNYAGTTSTTSFSVAVE
jgi:hypothetical protein